MKKWFLILIGLIGLGGLFIGSYSILEKKPVSGLQIITDDATCSVFLNDQYLDKSPLINKQIKPGTYNLRLEPNDPKLAPYQTQIELNENLLTVVTWKPGERAETSGGVIYELKPISGNQGKLSFVTVPDQAIIELDQKKQKFSPVTFNNVEPGHHQFSINLPAYEKQEHTINIVKGHQITVTAQLARSKPSEMELDLQKKEETSARNATIAAQLATNSATDSSEASQSATTSPQATTSATVTIKPTNFYQDGVEVLRVRAEASLDGKQVGLAKVGEEYPYLKQSSKETTDVWYQIKLEEIKGWISSEYAELND